MSWITLDNLKRFWKGLRTNPITFTGEIDLQNTTRYKGNEIATKADVAAGGSNITIDDALSATSTNPVQNKAVKAELDKKWSTDATNLNITSTRGFPLTISSAPTDEEYTGSYGASAIKLHDKNGGTDYRVGNITRVYNDRKKKVVVMGNYNSDTINIKKYSDDTTIEKTITLATEDYVKSAIAAIADYDDTKF